MQNILELKQRYEDFSRMAMKSTEIKELVSRNKTWRHLLRFAASTVFLLGMIKFLMIAWETNWLLGIILFPIYLFFQGLVISGFMIHAHELSHNHIKIKFLNDGLGVINGILSFTNFYSFKYAHRFHHRNIGNLDEPESGAPISLKGQGKIRANDNLNKKMILLFSYSKLLWATCSWPLFVFYGDYCSWLLPYKKNGRLDTSSLVTFAVFIIFQSFFVFFTPLEYWLLYIVPMLIGGNRILVITFLHHAFEKSVFFNTEHHNHLNVIMANTDRNFGRIVNFFMMNNGYHVPHHIQPQIAYYDLPKASRYLASIIPEDLYYPFLGRQYFYRQFTKNIYEQRLRRNYEVYRPKLLEFSKAEHIIHEKARAIT